MANICLRTHVLSCLAPVQKILIVRRSMNIKNTKTTTVTA
jgi:hypothetical protein